MIITRNAFKPNFQFIVYIPHHPTWFTANGPVQPTAILKMVNSQIVLIAYISFPRIINGTGVQWNGRRCIDLLTYHKKKDCRKLLSIKTGISSPDLPAWFPGLSRLSFVQNEAVLETHIQMQKLYSLHCAGGSPGALKGDGAIVVKLQPDCGNNN